LIDRFLDNACPDHHVRGLQDHLRARHTAFRLLDRSPDIAENNFHVAIECGEIAIVRRFLAANPALATTKNPESPYRAVVGNFGDLFHDLGPKGWEPLLYLCFTRLPLPAVDANAVNIARLLLEHGADPNAYFMAGASRYTPLVGVIGGGEEERPPHQRRDELVGLLLDGGAEPYDNQVLYNLSFNADYLWYLPLIHERSIQLGRGKDWQDPEWSMLSMGPYGSGAHWMLEHAIMRGDRALTEWCLEHGANPNSPTARGKRGPQETLYEAATVRGRTEIAELLVRHGARRTEVELEPEEAFVAACLRGDVGVVRDFLASHPKLVRASAALFAAVEKDRADVVELLLTAGMSPDVERDGRERPLHRAGANNAIRSARILLAHGAAIDPRDLTYGNTPLAVADHFQHREMIELLAEYSRDVWELSYLGKLERLRSVLAEEPRRARVSWEDQTPLMWLPPEDESVALEVVKELVRHGADPAVVNKHGATAADRAEAMGMFKVAAYLREQSAAAGPAVR
jgi:ankyrin repeat protein